ncbi:MAG: DUF2207 domain-containing protein, partial [Pyramidobacter sp.]
MFFRVIRGFAAAVALFLAAAPASALPAECILSFNADAEIGRDASMTVTETLRFTAAGVDIVHGLIRSIPVRYRNAAGQGVTVGLRVLSAELDGAAAPWKESREGRNTAIRIGSGAKALSVGKHTLKLTYKTDKQIGFFDDHDELYWNVNGTEWDFPILKTTFRLKLPGKSWGEGFERIAWYAGPLGSTDRSRAVKNPDNSITASRLSPGENLTVVYGWSKGIVTPPVPSFSEKLLAVVGAHAEALSALLIWLGTAAGAALLMKRLRRAARENAFAVVPLFHEPAGLSPSLARWIARGEGDAKSLTSELIAMAIQGLFTIDGNAKEGYSLERGDGDKSADRPLREKIYRALFPAGSPRTLRLEKSQRSAFSKALSCVTSDVKRRSKALRSKERPLRPVFAAPMVAAVASAALASLSDADPDIVSASMLCLMLNLVSLFASGKRSPRKKNILLHSLSSCAPLLPVLAVMAASGSFGHNPELTLPCVALSITGLLLQERLIPWTDEGRKAVAQTRGLEMFITAAGKDRLETLNAPDDSPALFEELLPYAVALDCAKTW